MIPISQWGVTLPGGYNARAMTAGWRKLLPSYRGHGIQGAIRRFRQQIDPRWVWRNADLCAYLWITWQKRTVQAKRWVIFEWDMYASVSVRDFYRDVWDEDIVGSFQQMPGLDDFYYFTDKENARIPTALQPHLMAATPWAGMFFSDRALNGIARVVRGTN